MSSEAKLIAYIKEQKRRIETEQAATTWKEDFQTGYRSGEYAAYFDLLLAVQEGQFKEEVYR